MLTSHNMAFLVCIHLQLLQAPTALSNDASMSPFLCSSVTCQLVYAAASHDWISCDLFFYIGSFCVLSSLAFRSVLHVYIKGAIWGVSGSMLQVA
jgi:hypothetical protein